MNKQTAELLHELQQAHQLETYFTVNKEEISSISLKDFLENMLFNKNLSKVDVIKKSGLYPIYAYQIFAGKKKPSRNKLLSLCFGMELLLDEAQRLLTIANVGILYPRVKRDSIIIFALHKRITIFDCNEMLYECGEEIME